RFEPPNDIEGISSAVLGLRGRESDRRPYIRISPTEASARGHHTDHRELLIVEQDRLIENVRIAAEAPLPKLVNKDRHIAVAGPIFLGGKVSTDLRWRARE